MSAGGWGGGIIGPDRGISVTRIKRLCGQGKVSGLDGIVCEWLSEFPPKGADSGGRFCQTLKDGRSGPARVLGNITEI